MNIHAYNASIQLYLQEKRIECDKWGGFGFRLVTAHENLARAHYMGDKAFSLQAKRYIIKAIERMEYMLPTTHFRFVPLYTLKTLIFAKEYTEINMDTLNDQNWDIYQQLLTQIFESSVKDLGENNLHTAIILGNMGKIYHILKRYTVSGRDGEMRWRAILQFLPLNSKPLFSLCRIGGRAIAA